MANSPIAPANIGQVVALSAVAFLAHHREEALAQSPLPNPPVAERNDSLLELVSKLDLPDSVRSIVLQRNIDPGSVERREDAWFGDKVDPDGARTSVFLGDSKCGAQYPLPQKTVGVITGITPGKSLSVFQYGGKGERESLSERTRLRKGDSATSKFGTFTSQGDGTYTFTLSEAKAARVVFEGAVDVQVIDRLPQSLDEEGGRVVRTKSLDLPLKFIKQHPEEDVVVVVTVPVQCPPCVVLDKQMKGLFSSPKYKSTKGATVFVVEMFDFVQPSVEALGQKTVVPTVLLFGEKSLTEGEPEFSVPLKENDKKIILGGLRARFGDRMPWKVFRGAPGKGDLEGIFFPKK